MQIKIISISLVMIGIVFVGCSRRNVSPNCSLTEHASVYSMSEKNYNFENPVKNKDLVTLAKQQLLPIPAGYKIKSYSKSKESIFYNESFFYEGHLDNSHILNFYKKELEVLGWVYVDLSTKKEGLLVATQTEKKCVISIRPNKQNSSALYLFVHQPCSTQESNAIDLNKINRERLK